MTRVVKILAVFLLFLSAITEINAQPRWVKGTPSVASTGPLTITMNYGIDRIGTVYIIVYNYNNKTKLTSRNVRDLAIGGPSGTLVATAVLPVNSQNINKILQVILDVNDPGRLHTIYAVAASSLGRLQSSPVKLTATTLSCPAANAGNGGSECDRDFSLNAVPGIYPGTWTKTTGPGSATFSPDSKTPNATVTVSEYGTYTFTWTIEGGSCKISSTITVNFYQRPLANAGTGGNNCGLSFHLRAISSVGTGTWSIVSGPGRATFNPNAGVPDAEVVVTQYGTYVFRWTEINGICSGEASVSVTFVQQSIANAGNGGDECDRDFLLNAVPGSFPGTWTKISGPGDAVFSPNPNQHDARVSVSQSGAYDFAWTIINSLCSSTDIIRVTFHDLPAVNAGEDVGICVGGNIQLHAIGSGTFEWTPQNLIENPNVFNPIAFPVATTIFTVTLTDQYGCRNSDQVTVEVRENTIADAGPDQVLEFQFETDLEAVLNFSNETGEWSVLSGSGRFDDKNSTGTRVSELSLDENLFMWTVTNGLCPISKDTVSIIVRGLVIPTLITPNLDGKNDFFIIRGLQSLGKTEIIIFNRWGAAVYRNNDYGNDWDGTDNNGEPLSDDTYFYNLIPVKSKSIRGYLVIKRTNEKDY